MCSSPWRHEWVSACQFMVLFAHYLNTNSTNIGRYNRELLSLDLEKINNTVCYCKSELSMTSIDSIMMML